MTDATPCPTGTVYLEATAARQVHGRLDKLGQRPVALEWGGRLQTVVWHRKRWDLNRETLTRSRLEVWHDFWEVELADGTRLVVYRDLQHAGWYHAPDALMGPEADAACAEIERKAAESVAWLRAQAAEEAEREARRAARKSR